MLVGNDTTLCILEDDDVNKLFQNERKVTWSIVQIDQQIAKRQMDGISPHCIRLEEVEMLSCCN